MHFEIFGLVIMTRDALDDLTNTFMSVGKKHLDEQRRSLENQHNSELARLERITESHHDTLKKALNYMMTALGGVPMEGYDNSELPEGKIPELIVSDAYKESQACGRMYEPDLDLSRDASKLIPDLEAELKRLRDAQKSTHATDPTNDTHIQAQDQYDLDGTGINEVLGIWGSAIASVQDSKTNPGVQSE